MTSTDRDTMLRAVLLDPADDLARLAFADACEEAGDIERAEFVRDQVEWRPGSRDIDLLDANLEAWCPWLGRHPELGFGRDFGDPGPWGRMGLKVVHAGGEVTMWGGGLIQSVALPLAAFMEHAEELFSRHPITAVRLTDREPNDVSTAERGVLHAWLKWRWDYMKTILAPAGSSQPYDVPHELFGDGPSKWLYFDTPALALAALSAACVAYGRRKAGLPPLPEKEHADGR